MSRSNPAEGANSPSSVWAGLITLLSHSPTDMPDRRAAVRAASRASGRRPLRFQGPPDFMLTSKSHEEQDVPSVSSRCREQTTRRARFSVLAVDFSGIR